MTAFGVVDVEIEFMDGETRVIENVGGAINSPSVSADGLLQLGYKSGLGARLEHRGSYPMVNIRCYRLLPERV